MAKAKHKTDLYSAISRGLSLGSCGLGKSSVLTTKQKKIMKKRGIAFKDDVTLDTSLNQDNSRLAFSIYMKTPISEIEWNKFLKWRKKHGE